MILTFDTDKSPHELLHERFPNRLRADRTLNSFRFMTTRFLISFSSLSTLVFV